MPSVPENRKKQRMTFPPFQHPRSLVFIFQPGKTNLNNQINLEICMKSQVKLFSPAKWPLISLCGALLGVFQPFAMAEPEDKTLPEIVVKGEVSMADKNQLPVVSES